MEAWAALKLEFLKPIRIQDRPRTGLGQQLTVQAVVDVKGTKYLHLLTVFTSYFIKALIIFRCIYYYYAKN